MEVNRLVLRVLLSLAAAPAAAETPGPFRNPEAAIDPAAVLLARDDELHGAAIGWRFSVADAVVEAKRGGLPLVYVSSRRHCGYCNMLVNETLVCAAVNRFAGRAVFVLAEETDPATAQLDDVLGIEKVPSISVLDLSGDVAEEVLRMQGLIGAAELGRALGEALAQLGAAPPLGNGINASRAPLIPSACRG